MFYKNIVLALLIELGLEDLAKYPFIKEAGEYIKKLNIQIEDLNHPDYINIIQRAKERIKDAINKRMVSKEIQKAEVDILSFPIALLIVRMCNNDYLASIYSLAEAIRIEEFLKYERKSIISHIFKTVLNIDVIEVLEDNLMHQFDYKIKIKEYLKRSTQFHELEWKLINRVVNQGYVYLKTHELIRLIREEIRKIIYNRIKNMATPKLPKVIEDAVSEISGMVQKLIINKERISSTLTPKNYPPCVNYALNTLQKGQNLPHFGRFLLSTYLLNIGKTVDEIIQLYPKLPDFNERITKYQVEHIAGLRGGRIKYKCPSCKTLQTHGLCFKDETCDEIKNPLQYGRVKSKK
ncbi:MAG: DNA primase large subunit PriL [Nitrososphaerales archaeon]